MCTQLWKQLIQSKTRLTAICGLIVKFEYLSILLIKIIVTRVLYGTWLSEKSMLSKDILIRKELNINYKYYFITHITDFYRIYDLESILFLRNETLEFPNWIALLV